MEQMEKEWDHMVRGFHKTSLLIAVDYPLVGYLAVGYLAVGYASLGYPSVG